MNRLIVYPGAIPLDTDILKTEKHALYGIAKLAAAVLGSSTLVNGLSCSATGPASMQVSIGAGEIYSLQNVDGSAYGSLAQDLAHQIVKQGINIDATLISMTAPGSGGQSVNYLIEAQYQDVDGTPVVLPYYNASNPSQAYSGPGNTGVSQNTIRAGVVALQAKVGTAATTGTQTTPSADAGWTGLWVVTIANGQTTITGGNIAQLGGAPFITERLGDKISAATANSLYAQNSSTAGILNYISATGINFSPRGGNKILVAGTLSTIPSGGVAAANTSVYVNGTAAQNLAASTKYYVYLFSNAGTLTVDFSTTAYAVSASDGTMIKSGDGTRALIGLVTTNGSSQFAANDVRSWFNDSGLIVNGSFSTNRTYSSGTPGVPNAEITQTFSVWANEPVDLRLNASLQQSSGSGSEQTQIGIDGAGVGTAALRDASTPGAFNTAVALSFVTTLSEGQHTATLLSATNGTGTITYVSGATLTGRVGPRM